MNKILSMAVVLSVVLGSVLPAAAEQKPQAGKDDPRVQTVVYSPKNVVRVLCRLGFITNIQLSPSEKIVSVALGDSAGWEVTRLQEGDRLIVKPKEANPGTNLIVATDAPRTYVFSLVAAANPTEEQTWLLSFRYPEEEEDRKKTLVIEDTPVALVNPNAPTDVSKFNFDYTYSGAKEFRPVQVFDDGQFTYLRFPEEMELPAIFQVDANKNESLVSSRRSGEYVVLNLTGRQFSLRSGKALTCIFNRKRQPKQPPANAPALDAKAAQND